MPDLGMNANAQAAMALIASLPRGSGVNPIGVDPAYPWPPAIDQVEGFDPVVGFSHWMDWYYAHPAPDKSGLFFWTNNAGGTQPAPNLSYVERLAYQVLAAGGDTSWSADFHSGNVSEQTNGIPSGYVASTVTPGSPDAVPPTPVTTGDPFASQAPLTNSGTIHQDPVTGAYVSGPAVVQTGLPTNGSTGQVLVDPILLHTEPLLPYGATDTDTPSGSVAATVPNSSGSTLAKLGVVAALIYVFRKAL